MLRDEKIGFKSKGELLLRIPTVLSFVVFGAFVDHFINTSLYPDNPLSVEIKKYNLENKLRIAITLASTLMLALISDQESNYYGAYGPEQLNTEIARNPNHKFYLFTPADLQNSVSEDNLTALIMGIALIEVIRNFCYGSSEVGYCFLALMGSQILDLYKHARRNFGADEYISAPQPD